MYKKILNTLFQWNRDQACEHILWLYQHKWFCVVDYLYFANISGKKLFSSYQNYSVSDFETALLADYKANSCNNIYASYQHAILDADVVLLDGIALQIFNALATKKWIDNLNGTDFCPYFLSYIKKKHQKKDVRIVLYGTHPHLLEKTQQLLTHQWYHVVYVQDGYSNLDWEKVALALKGSDDVLPVLLVARSTPDFPIQELRTLANKNKIREHKLIVMNQWGTFDFWVGEQKRAPKLIRTIKLERLRRLILDPKRNIKKVLSSLAILKYIFLYLILKKG